MMEIKNNGSAILRKNLNTSSKNYTPLQRGLNKLLQNGRLFRSLDKTVTH
jgi:hypothetical protein